MKLSRTIARRLLVFSAVSFVAGLIPPSLVANRFRNNPERVVNRQLEKWSSPLGELEAKTAGRKDGVLKAQEFVRVGTGVLVSPCYIMTAAHVAYGDDLDPIDATDYRMTFRAGTSAGSAFAGNTTATPVISGSRDASHRNDWALMRLNNCVGGRPELGWYESLGKSDQELLGLRVISLGYEAEAARGTLVLGTGHLGSIDGRSGLVSFDGTMQPGTSGGPVLIVDHGALVIAAVNVFEAGGGHGATFDRYSVDRANFVKSTDFLSKPYIKAVLDADKAAFGQPNPAAERLRMDHLPR